jgi:hypothetical protein
VAYRDEGLSVSTANKNSRIPLFPRGTAITPVCQEAMRGEITIADTIRWRGVRGRIVIAANQITTGAEFRDAYARKAVYQSQAHPEITFDIDSLTEVQVQGDTVHAVAVGALHLLGRKHVKTGRVAAWRVPGGLRVRAQLQVPAKDLVTVYGISAYVLQLGVVLGRWDSLYMGIDVVLQSPDASS